MPGYSPSLLVFHVLMYRPRFQLFYRLVGDRPPPSIFPFVAFSSVARWGRLIHRKVAPLCELSFTSPPVIVSPRCASNQTEQQAIKARTPKQQRHSSGNHGNPTIEPIQAQERACWPTASPLSSPTSWQTIKTHLHVSSQQTEQCDRKKPR